MLKKSSDGVDFAVKKIVNDLADLESQDRRRQILNQPEKYNGKEGFKMKRNKLLLTVAGPIIIITMAIFVGKPLAIETAKQCAIATIKSHEGISPETLHIRKGDCVAWINRTGAEDVKITFKEGKRCQDMTESAVGFKKDGKNCCVTDYLAPGRISSLLFDQAGTFNYEVEFRPSSRSGSGFRIDTQRFGTIIVE